MTWSRIDENAPGHPKVNRAGLDGFGFHVAGVCFCNRFLTNGRIRPDELGLIFPGVTKTAAAKLVQRLVAAGLWEEDGTEWLIHDFLVYNPSAAEVRRDLDAASARQRARRQRLREGTERSHNGSHAGSHADSHAVTSDDVTPGVRDPGPSRSDPIRSDPIRSVQKRSPHSPPEGGNPLPPGFERFWRAYPKSVAKDRALAAWRKRGCEPIADDVLAGLERTRPWIEREGGEFTKNPATWLNDGGWKDEPPEIQPKRNINDAWKGKPSGEVKL